jgi:preprotein translocase SecE subunit
MGNGVVTKTAARGKTDNALGRMFKFLREAYTEVRYKASWPSWSELKKFTTVVIVAVIIVMVWIGGIDWILTNVTHWLDTVAKR